MKKTYNNKRKPKDRRQGRKMKPYCLTAEKAHQPSWLDNDFELQDLEYRSTNTLKKMRKDFREARRADNKWTRHQAKEKIRIEVQEYLDND